LKLIEPFVNRLKNSDFLSKFYNQNDNYKCQLLFVDSQLVIHALKALSNMVMASYNEDQYGIVQQTLPSILTTFAELQKVGNKQP
jgi:nucleoporin NDC1